MTGWTPESLARAFHEAYGRAAARLYGHGREPEAWDSLPGQSRALSVAACAELLGEAREALPQPPPAVLPGTPVPTREEFAEAAELAEASEAEGDSSEGDGGAWRRDLERQIDSVTAPRIRRVLAGSPMEEFRK